MVQINFALKEVNCKIVYYGPGLSGKTTNLEVVHGKAPDSHVGELTSIATEGDRTLFFDFLPLNLGQVAGMTTKFQLYTVPGQVYYNSTRKLVLQGADGIVFVADSRKGKMDENIESLRNLEENLSDYGMDINTIPLVMQYNKRDLPELYTVEELQSKLNRFGVPCYEAVAVTGEGVFPTLKKLSSMVLESLNRQQGSTAVKVPQSQLKAAAAKQPVAVSSGTASRPPSSRSLERATPGGKGKPPSQRGPARSARGRPGDRPKREVVRERVVRSPDVKPIERRTAPRSEGRTVAQRRQAMRVPITRKPPPKRKSALLWIILAAVLGLGALVYFSGILDSFLK